MKFQTLLLTIFGVAAVVSVVVFANTKSKNQAVESGGNVAIWGTFQHTKDLADLITDFNREHRDQFTISYEFHDAKNFDSDIVEALSSQKGPDVLLLPDDLVLRHFDKVELIPYTMFPPATFSSLFVQSAEIYLRDGGLEALPFAIDPMVMYWNRDLFNNASITAPPKYWDEFLEMTPKLTRRNNKTSELLQSALPFGEFTNVNNAKDLIAMLFLQVGNPIVKIEKNVPVAKVTSLDGSRIVPDESVVSAFRFFMDFSNPLKSNFTWSLARGNSLNEFIDGNLAVHFDYASAYNVITKKNPHLNFAVAPMPQPRNTSAEITFGRMHGLAVLKTSKNKQTAFLAIQRLLLDPLPAKRFAAAFSLPPVRRDLLADKPTNPEMSIFYDSAIRARTWLDPKPQASDKAFRDMVELVSSGRSDAPAAVSKLNGQLEVILKSYKSDAILPTN